MTENNSTLKEIALKLNISISTVSRALKNHPRISIKTKNKVLKLAREIGYKSPTMLFNEDKKKSKFIGVIVPNINYHLYAMAISGIEAVAETQGMHIIVCQSNELYEREKSLVKELIEAGVVGIISSLASETTDFSHFEDVKKAQIPLVFFNRQCDDIETDKVIIDNYKAAYDATEHLITIGCKRIGYLGGPEILQINSSRARGFTDALEKNSLELNPDYVVFSNFNRESTLSAARKLLYSPNYPDGILAFSDQMAISVMIAAKERGISIPEKVSLIGFNNEPIDELLEPSLTSVNQPSFNMGEEAAKLLLKQLNTPTFQYEKKVLKSFLVIRNSTNKNKL